VDPEAWDSAWRSGAAMSHDAAIARGLVALGAPDPTPQAAGRVAV
jgi:hypothetical protein